MDKDKEELNFAGLLKKDEIPLEFFENDFEPIVIPAYPEIAAIENFINDCESECVEGWAPEEEHDTEYDHFKFLRIGEETDDVEEKGGFAQGDIYVSRSVSF